MRDKLTAHNEIINLQIKEIVALYAQMANKVRVSEKEFWVWYALTVIGDEYSQQDLSQLFGVPKQTVNSMVSGMVNNGYVTLESDGKVRNRKIIRLTELGKKYGDEIVEDACRAERKAFSRFSAEERDSLISVFGRYIDYLREAINDK